MYLWRFHLICKGFIVLDIALKIIIILYFNVCFLVEGLFFADILPVKRESSVSEQALILSGKYEK